MIIHYLELSNEDTGEHKFYEITEDQQTPAYTVRYGRIGTPGQSKHFDCVSPAAVRKAVDKVLAEKENKGYEIAIPGESKVQETRHHLALRVSKVLYGLIANGNAEAAKTCSTAFKEFIEDPDNKEEYEEELSGLFLAGFRDAGDAELTFSVDWKDTESMIDSIVALCANLSIDITFDWGTKKPTKTLRPGQIMLLAHAQLAPLGFGLWHWDTDGDSFEGWIAPLVVTQNISEAAAELDFGVRFPDPNQM